MVSVNLCRRYVAADVEAFIEAPGDLDITVGELIDDAMVGRVGHCSPRSFAFANHTKRCHPVWRNQSQSHTPGSDNPP
jgi:hypothetical protein